MKTSMKSILLHGCNICVGDPTIFGWNVSFRRFMTLSSYNVFMVNPKVFVWNANNLSNEFYCMPAMLWWPTNN